MGNMSGVKQYFIYMSQMDRGMAAKHYQYYL